MSNTRVLMIGSAVALGLMGLVVSFAPEELLTALGVEAEPPMPVILKLMGGLYLGFALLNWMAKDNIIGGIYSRPVAIGNFLHFFVGALSLIKYQLSAELTLAPAAALAVYLVFGAWFGWLVFGRGGGCAVAGDAG